jgi:hypothetical protein
MAACQLLRELVVQEAVADFVMKGGGGNYTQLDLRLNNPDNIHYVSAMTFTNAGRVGINNASPGSTLDVTGTANVSGVSS